MSTDSVSSLVGADHCGVNAILSVLADCTAPEHSNGRAWYRRANRFARKVGALTGKRPETVAAVIARLSPQCTWKDNKQAALLVCAGEIVSGVTCYPDNILRAESIAAADDDETIALEVLPRKGFKRPKISAFYRNIAQPDCAHTVTVDTWAARIWVGDCEAPTVRISAKESATIQGDYRAAADIAGLLPQELQAITWVGAHRIQKERGQRSLFDIGLAFKI